MKQLKLPILFSLILFSFSYPETDINSNSVKSLFKIERSKDDNKIIYDVNINNKGEIDTLNPINIYWIKNSKGGKVEALTWIQKKYAYGLKYFNIYSDYATFQFVSYDKLFFKLKKRKNGHFEVHTKCNGKLLKVERIFIQIDGGSFWFPKISAVKIYAQNLKTGQEVIEIINP